MKFLLTILGNLIEWVGSVVWAPVHLRNMVQMRAVESQAQVRAAHARELQANVACLATLWNMGTDFRPLARHIAVQLHAAYGVRPSDLVPGQVVPLEQKK